jgi:hypothetical protein
MLRCPPSAIRCFVITAVIGAALTGTADAGPVKAIMADKAADLTPKHRTLRLDLKTRIVEYCRHYPSSSDRRHSRHSEPNGVSDTLVFPVSDAVGVFELIPAKP